MNYISEIIGDEYKNWTPEKPVVIHAQTGTGKTHFILEKLLPYVYQTGRKMVYLSNRVALEAQVKGKIRAEYQDSIVTCNYQRFSFLSFVSTEQDQYGMTEEEQSKADFDRKLISADYYILDEAHYFLEDAEFNMRLNECLNRMREIRNRERKSIWIFMTATVPYLFLSVARIFNDISVYGMCEIPFLRDRQNYGKYGFSYSSVENLLKHKEAPNIHIENYLHYTRQSEDFGGEAIDEYVQTYYMAHKNHFSVCMEQIEQYIEEVKSYCRYYTTDSDFSYIKPIYYTNDEEIITAIQRTPKEEKWLIFVESKHRGEQLERRLLECGYDDTVFLTAQNKDARGSKSRQVFKDIIKKEMFCSRILIATKVLDNGVNLHDDRLKHIVVPTFEETTFLQAIGRKRRKNEADSVRIYVKDVSERGIRKNFQNHVLNMIRFLVELKRVQEKVKPNTVMSSQAKGFFLNYTENGQYKKPYAAYIQPRNMSMTDAGAIPIKADPKLLIDIYEPSPYLSDKLTYAYYKMMSTLEKAQNERMEQLKDCRFDNLDDYQRAEEALSQQQFVWLKKQLSWIGVNDYDETCWITYEDMIKARKRLEEFLRDHNGVLKEGEQERLKNLFCVFVSNIRPARQYSKSKGSIAVINRCFKEVGIQYVIKSKKCTCYGKQRNWWIVEPMPEKEE